MKCLRTLVGVSTCLSAALVYLEQLCRLWSFVNLLAKAAASLLCMKVEGKHAEVLQSTKARNVKATEP